jgi:glutathione synthase/RimK-type ligase-like ATP-grasp enzyme
VDSKDILLLTFSQDFYTVDLVERALSNQGYRPFRFNLDLFPGQIQLAIRLKSGEMFLTLEDNVSGRVIESSDIKALWLRKMGTPHIAEEMEPLLRNGCLRESKETLNIFLTQLETIPWMDRPSVVKRSNDKLLQLRTAESVGMNIPKTLITNNPQEVKDFFHHLKGNVVSKMLTPLTTSMSGNTPFVYTNRLKEEDLDELHMLEHSPMVFQEFIPKSCELRIAYVNGKLFTGAIGMGKGKDVADWRQGNKNESPWQDFNVPEEMATKIRQLMKKMGLYFGAIDVIVNPNNQYTFLEVNPTGEWGMLERDLELPISGAIADTLMSMAKGEI